MDAVFRRWRLGQRRPLIPPSIGEERKTYFAAGLGVFDPGVCPRVGSATSSRNRSPVFAPGRRCDRHGRFGWETHDGVRPCAGRSRSGAVLHGIVRTILPSGPLLAIASFGSAEGHSLCRGSLGQGSWTRRNMDAHLRTHCARSSQRLPLRAASQSKGRLRAAVAGELRPYVIT